MSNLDDSGIGLEVENSLLHHPNDCEEDSEPLPDHSLAKYPNLGKQDENEISGHDDLDTAAMMDCEESTVTNLSKSDFAAGLNLHSFLGKSKLGQQEFRATQRAGNSVERNSQKPAIIQEITKPESVISQATEEEVVKCQINEMVANFQTLMKDKIQVSFDDEIAGYDKELEEIKKEHGYREAREAKEFIERRKESAKKIFTILKADFDKMVDTIKSDTYETTKLTPDLLKTRHNDLEVLYKRLESRLTVYLKKDQIVESLKKNRITIVVGAPGCGKSTQIPQLILTEKLLDDPKRKIFMVSPRMAAARKVCDRINEELSEELCTFHSGEKASIELSPLNFAVDYEFYRRLAITKEVKLEEIEYLIIDEANSKKMYTEVVLSMSRKLMRTHTHLKLVILSTSLNKFEIENFFRSNEDLEVDAEDAIEIEDGNFRTETIYQALNGSTEEKINQVLISIEERIFKQIENSKKKKILNPNILMFLRGASEVRTIFQKFNEWLPEKDGLISLSSKLKDIGCDLKVKYKLFMASGASDMVLDNEMLKPNQKAENGEEYVKLIFSTKVLETSLTIPNLGYVVDFGEEHVYAFDHSIGVEILREQKISRDTSIQRRGRVGRTCRGVCYKLYKEEDLTEEHSMSELSYKKLDVLVLSWIQIALDIRKTKVNPYFDMRSADTTLDESTAMELTSEETIDTLTNIMSRFQLTSEIQRDSIQKSLRLMKDLSIIDKDTLTSGLGEIHKAVLASGAELCFGKAIYRAIRECGGAKDLREHTSKVPWLLEEVISMVACNTYNRKIVTEKLPPELDTRLRELMRDYGDFAYNYEIYKVYDEKSHQSAELHAQVNILRGFANNAHMIRSRIQKLLQLPNGFFKNIRQKYMNKVPDKERYQLVTQCLTYGFASDISMHIADKIGYYNYRTKQIVQISRDATIRVESDAPKFLVASDILAQDSRFVSRFSFKTETDLLKSNFSKIIKYLDNLDKNDIPTMVYERRDLSSDLIHQICYRDFMLTQILNKKCGTLLSLSERGMELRIALTGKSEAKMSKLLNRLIKYHEENVNNHTVELFLEGCRVSVGSGLKITDIITYRETTSFYHFLVPRYVTNDKRVLTEGEDQKQPENSMGQWDFLLFHYKEFFGIQDKEMKIETTVSKVNYNANNQMNLKISCKTLKDMEDVRERIRKRQAELIYPKDSSMKKSEVKFYDKQTFTNDLGTIMKPIILGVFLFTKQNLGTCTIKGVSRLEMDKVVDYIRAERINPHSIFGPNFRVETTKDAIELSGLPGQLDEYSVEKFLNKRKELIMFSISSLAIKMYKKATTDTTHQADNLEMYAHQLEELIERMIEEKQKSLSSGERFPNEFICRLDNKKGKRYDYMVEIQVRATSYDLVELIKQNLDGRYYNSGVGGLEGEQSYKLGVAYTHVEVYDRPEFYCQKSQFMKFKGFIDDVNNSIIEQIEPKYNSGAVVGKGSRDAVKKALTKVDYPDEDWLNSLKLDENVRITIKKGQDREIADQAERILVNYFRGTEFVITPEQYSFWFGGEGKKFIEALKGTAQAQKEYAIIQTVPNRSLVVLKALRNSLQETEDPNSIGKMITQRIESLKQKRESSLFIKATLREIELLQKSPSFKSLRSKLREGSTISTFSNHGGLIVIETSEKSETESLKKQVNAELIKIRETQKHLFEWEKTCCHMCKERGNIQRLHHCSHEYCFLCLQQTIYQALDRAEEEVKKQSHPKINVPYVFCNHPGCNQQISSTDIFKVLSENMVNEKMKTLVQHVLKNKENVKDLIKCSGCSTFNRVVVKRANINCFSCSMLLTNS